MKFIKKKGLTPSELTTWKSYHSQALNKLYSDPNKTGTEIWKYLDNYAELDALVTSTYNKKKLKSSLLKDQGYICCYCGKRIKEDHRTILEHLNPKSKSKYKNRTYDYTNLLASCDGGSSYKVHRVKSGDTLASIAREYDVKVDYLIDIYVDIPTLEHINKLTQLYDIENLTSGDRLFIIPIPKKAFQHCDAKKDNVEIPLHPTSPGIENYFTYLPDGMIDVSGNVNLKTTVEVLGLNKNPLLVAERKTVVKTATSKKRAVLKACKQDPILYKKAINKLCEEYVTKINNQFEPYSFVLVSALK